MRLQIAMSPKPQALDALAEAFIKDGLAHLLHDDGAPEGEAADIAGVRDRLVDHIDPETEYLELSIALPPEKLPAHTVEPSPANIRGTVYQFAGSFLFILEGTIFHGPNDTTTVITPEATYYEPECGLRAAEILKIGPDRWKAVVSPEVDDETRFAAQDVDLILRRPRMLFGG